MPCLSITHKYHGGLESEISGDVKNEVEASTETTGPLSKQIASAVDDAAVAKMAADSAQSSAARAKFASEEALRSADSAAESANNAKTDADLARSEAQAAKDSATQASGHASAALRQLDIVENIVGVLDLLQKNGDYTLTADDAPEDAKWYFIRSGSGTDADPYRYSVVSDLQKEYLLTQDVTVSDDKTYYTRTGEGTEEDPYVYTEVEEPRDEDLATYYEYTNSPHMHGYYELVGIDEAIQNYVSSHMVLANDGLWLQPDDTSAKVHISTEAGNEGVIIYGTDGTILASYGSIAVIGDRNSFHLELEGTELGFYKGSEKIAYMNGSELYVENRLSFGNFAFMQRSNGHFTLKFVGIS